MSLRKIITLAAAALMFVSVSASASHIVYVQETFGSGAAFTGSLTFSNDYLSLESGTGTLSGGPYGSILLNQTYFAGAASTLVSGGMGNDWLLDGPPTGLYGTDYHHFLGFVWTLIGSDLTLLGSPIDPYFIGLSNYNPLVVDNESVRTVSLSLTAPLPPPGPGPSPIPEPASIALMGLGLFGFAASRRKAAKSTNA
jgi:hypothetical protein